MNKFVILVSLLLFVPVIAVESSAYFGGDMIEKNSLLFNFDDTQMESEIITINQSNKNENLKLNAYKLEFKIDQLP